MFARLALVSLVFGMLLALFGACTVNELSYSEQRGTAAVETRHAEARSTINARTAATKLELTAVAAATMRRVSPTSLAMSSPSSTPPPVATRTPTPEGRLCDEQGCWYPMPSQAELDAWDEEATEYTQQVEAETDAELDESNEGAGVVGSSDADWSDCDQSYPDFCIPPPALVGDLDCADVDGSYFTVYDPDPHGFDGDFDGVGCEWP